MKVVNKVMDELIIPGTCTHICDGTIVMIAKFPGTKWIVHKGWYTYQNKQYLGWYFCSIPAQVIMPVTEEDLYMVTIVSTDHSCCPNPPSPPCPPKPDVDPWMWQARRAWITVDTIEQRNQLNKQLVPNGKIVRVNDAGDGPKYYIYNQVDQVWEEFQLGNIEGSYLTKEQADKLYLTINSLDWQAIGS